MGRQNLYCFALFFIMAGALALRAQQSDDFRDYAQLRKADLKLGVYATAHNVIHHLCDEMGRREALSLLSANGISRLFLEFYRSGLIVPPDTLVELVRFFKAHGFEISGGIATLPGQEFGVAQEGPLGWFNWQHKKTQNDLADLMRTMAPLFDTMIVDDFFCTADTSAESKSARGNNSWSVYRRELLTQVADQVILQTAKRIHPALTLIIKYPQWYDRFHLFGYDLPRKSALFDQVWVGTETRGATTQRYGFVQPYQAFINYRWIRSISDKTSGAWFDHGDCTALDFIDQAFQSVLAGAKELTIFSYGELVNGHPGHHLLRTQFDLLADLAGEIDPLISDVAYSYKPPNSDAGGDLYLMDFVGMFGVPLVPTAYWPDQAKVIFLPTQSAADPAIVPKFKSAVRKGTTLVLTSGFLAELQNSELNALAGVSGPVQRASLQADTIIIGQNAFQIDKRLDLGGAFITGRARQLITASHNGRAIPFLTQHIYKKATIYVLNCHTFSQQDFDTVGEVLLAPRPLGLLDLPLEAAGLLRQAFLDPLGMELHVPTRVAMQRVNATDWFLQNYNEQAVQVRLRWSDSKTHTFRDKTNGGKVLATENGFTLTLAPRSRFWLSVN